MVDTIEGHQNILGPNATQISGFIYVSDVVGHRIAENTGYKKMVMTSGFLRWNFAPEYGTQNTLASSHKNRHGPPLN